MRATLWLAFVPAHVGEKSSASLEQFAASHNLAPVDVNQQLDVALCISNLMRLLNGTTSRLVN